MAAAGQAQGLWPRTPGMQVTSARLSMIPNKELGPRWVVPEELAFASLPTIDYCNQEEHRPWSQRTAAN